MLRTRPGRLDLSRRVPAAEEQRGLLPVLRAVRAAVPLLIDARPALDAGAIVLDPGIEFGQTRAHDLALLAKLDVVANLGYPILVGVSRNGFIGASLDGAGPSDRLHGTAAAVARA